MKTIYLSVFYIVSILLLSVPAISAEKAQEIEDIDFSFEGPFGTYDRNQLQRGLQVYTEVCSGCHGLRQVAFRTLGDPGGPELEPKQVKAYAAQYEIFDPELDDYREGKSSDKFPTSGVENAPDPIGAQGFLDFVGTTESVGMPDTIGLIFLVTVAIMIIGLIWIPRK